MVHGKCPVCGTVYRWEARSLLRVKDAVCKDCNAGLKRPGRVKESTVVDVETDWLRPAPEGDWRRYEWQQA